MIRRYFSLALAVATLACAGSARATYVGNPIINRGGGDGTVTPPLVVIGEFNPTAPGPTSANSFPINGTITDVQVYADLPNESFTVYTLAAAGVNAFGNQQFTFLTGTTFTTTAKGAQTFPTSVPVQAGDLLAFWGLGPQYGTAGSDATYESPGHPFVALSPTVGGTYSFGTNGSSTNYEYLPGINGVQQDARTYSIGVDVSTPEPSALGLLAIAAIALVRRRRSLSSF
jgi:MYXO-CTERM domain-containing protein